MLRTPSLVRSFLNAYSTSRSSALRLAWFQVSMSQSSGDGHKRTRSKPWLAVEHDIVQLLIVTFTSFLYKTPSFAPSSRSSINRVRYAQSLICCRVISITFQSLFPRRIAAADTCLSFRQIVHTHTSLFSRTQVSE